MSFGDPRPAPKPQRPQRARERAPKPWRRPKADQVTPELIGELMGRDGGCVAPQLGTLQDGAAESESCRGRLTVEHVRDHAAMGAGRAPSDRRHCVLLCEWHHLESGWATAHKAELRAYLESVEGRGRA